MSLKFSANSAVDQYRQQALALGLSEQQQQMQSSHQQQMNALANDQAKLLVSFRFLLGNRREEFSLLFELTKIQLQQVVFKPLFLKLLLLNLKFILCKLYKNF